MMYRPGSSGSTDVVMTLTSNSAPGSCRPVSPVHEELAASRLIASLSPASAALRAASRSFSRPELSTWCMAIPSQVAPSAKTTKQTITDMTIAIPCSSRWRARAGFRSSCAMRSSRP